VARIEIARAKLLKAGSGRTFYCVGGTWRNLARLHMYSTGYPLDVMHDYEMGVVESAAFLKQVAAGEADKLKGINRISKSRRALLPYGAIVLQEIVRAMKPSRVVVSALGVREGYLYSLLNEVEQKADPLLSAADELALLRSRSARHARELAEWTDTAMAAFGLEESEDEVRWRKAACLLADIGWRAHPEYRGTQSLNIIAHASFSGVTHPGRAYLALANMFRHDGVYQDEIAPGLRALAGTRLIDRARVLGALLRVVYLLSASMPGVIPKLSWQTAPDGTLELAIPRTHAALMGERPDGRMAQLAKVLDRPMRLVLGE
jgi:exopolyphosphatase / guanosine-5'-triphosphate,3'-diphosphate pyrophosphatase